MSTSSSSAAAAAAVAAAEIDVKIKDETVEEPALGEEEEERPEGAFNPETKEFNWDCPCLGDLPKGPCGEEFKTAFSCFALSTNEPKGQDCIDAFRGMYECFKRYPEVYQNELKDDDDDDVDKEEEEGEEEERKEKADKSNEMLENKA